MKCNKCLNKINTKPILYKKNNFVYILCSFCCKINKLKELLNIP